MIFYKKETEKNGVSGRTCVERPDVLPNQRVLGEDLGAVRTAVSPLLAPVNVDVVFEHVYLVEGRPGHQLNFLLCSLFTMNDRCKKCVHTIKVCVRYF